MNQLPGYVVDGVIHDGVRSEIWRCRRLEDDLKVVVKILKNPQPSPDEVAQLRHEHDVALSLDAGAVVQPLALERHGGRWYMVLEDLGLLSLDHRLNSEVMDLAGFFSVALKIVNALAAVHRGQVIHKDVKPNNIVVSSGFEEVRLIDFGVASKVSREQPAAVSTRLVGTLSYVSPEQTGRMNRAVDYRTDFYSLGVTLFEMLTGRRPFEADTPGALIHCHIARPAPSASEVESTVPEGLALVVDKLLAKTAEERYQSLQGLAADLEHCQDEWSATGSVDSFVLASQDVNDRFRVSEKLYGRGQEIEALVAALDRVTVGAAEVVLITGRSGIGKSALVQEIFRPVTARNGYFITGKFDQLRRSSPHATLIETLTDLVHQILTESDAEVERWRRDLAAALGANGAVVSAVIPDVELIIGVQPKVPELGPVEAQNRFNLVLHDFIGVFARPEHPLAVFLDDAQWGDPGSLHLLELLMTDRYRQHMLLVLAYRDEEVVSGDGLLRVLEAIARSGTAITRLELVPLTLKETVELVADTVNRSSDDVAPLADLVFAKAGGNPFFTNELLTSLETDEHLRFDHGQRQWTWDLDRISELGVTDNVVELLAVRLGRLPQATQDTLSLAACVGGRFEVGTLVVVSGQAAHEVMKNLWPAVTAGLVLPLGRAHGLTGLLIDDLADRLTVELRFSHDRIQQAVYDLIEPTERPGLHRRVGEELLCKMADPKQDPRLFDVVAQLNLSRDLMVGREERDRLARLNLEAGLRARSRTAYEQAAMHLLIGVELLDDDCWERCYELALELHNKAAEASFLIQDAANLAFCTEAVLANAKTVLDAVPAHEAIIQAHVSRAEFGEAIEVALRLFKLLGVHLPRRPTPWAVMVALVATKIRLMGRRIEDLAELPDLEDPHKQAALRTLMWVSTAVYVSAPEWMPIMVFKGVELTIRHGIVVESAFALSSYGIVLCGVLGQIDDGYRFGQLGLKLIERFDNRELVARVSTVTSMLVRHWREPVRDTVPALLEGYRAGLETGDLEYAAHCIRGYCFTIYVCGTELPQVEKEMRRSTKVILRLGQDLLLLVHGAWHQAVVNLLQAEVEDPCRLMGEHYDEDQVVPTLEATNNRLALCDYYLNKLILLFLFGRAEEALEQASRGRRLLDGITSAASVPLFYFYDSLARLAVIGDGGGGSFGDRLKLRDNRRRLRRWARFSPANLQHRVLLVEAEWARVRGRERKAMQLYDQAINTAWANEYLQEGAVACELASRFHSQAGRHRVAGVYWDEARGAYLSWGAEAKVAAMDKELAQAPGRLAGGDGRRRTTRSASASGSNSSDGDASLDLAAVMGASQAISGELELDGLVTTLLRIVLANAGADRGVLVLNRDGRLVVEAVAERGGESMASSLDRVAETSDDLPVALVQYVARTQESLVLGDVRDEGRFSKDPYLRRHDPRSVLCVPLVLRGQLVGLLYLENTLTPGAFTADRVEVVGLLGTQAAISIGNVHAVASRAERERLRLEAEFLNTRNQELARLNADKDRFFSIISHDLRSPFNPLMGFSEILAAGGDTLPPERVKMLAEKVHSSARNVYNLLENLLEWTRIQTGRMDFKPQSSSLRKMITETYNLYSGNAEGKGIELRHDVPAELEVEVDVDMITTVIRNLVSNAIKFCETGGEVSISAEVGADGVEVQVADTGVGMEPKVVESLFKIDNRYSTTGTAAETGTGLGLILCRDLVDKNGGRIWVTSQPGRGSTFFLLLPLSARR